MQMHVKGDLETMYIVLRSIKCILYLAHVSNLKVSNLCLALVQIVYIE